MSMMGIEARKQYTQRMLRGETESTICPTRRRRNKRKRSESRRFLDRLRFDQSKFWQFTPELKSLIPSSWPAFEAAVRKFGLPISLHG